ncbi:CueP family metal-binding protein [uncultured Planococcus sp.]|uniref:CueP family metal-binding protein n=1 Tax=uncultured Planococcus sp. TaxID=337815 RepID=UPI002631D6B3|nr:CueP family metal-binding protein [uncultured Planococcus sp.]
MRVPFIVLMVALLGFLAGCTDDSTLNETEVKELVADLSGSDEVSAASIDDRELKVEDEEKTTIYPLPEEEFFVSIAPYETYTHPCEIHSLTGCQGELAEKEMKITVTDEQGEVHVDKLMTTPANGFIDLWLPRDQTYTVEIEADDKIGELQFSTFSGEPTCLTTIALS